MREVLFEVQDGIASITLNRAAQGNAINLNVARTLLDFAIKCDHDPEIRCVLLTGTGRFFCTGGDIREFCNAEQNIPHFLSELAGILHLAISRLMRMAKPLVVVVNGTAAGAGMSLALIGDIVLVEEKAQFSPAYGAIGLSPDVGLTWHLAKLVGLRKAQEILLLNQKLTAQEAHQMGLVSEVVASDQLTQRQTAITQQLADSALPALANIKQLLLSSHQNSLETHLELEARAISNISLGESAREGLTAFLQKRPAQFNPAKMKKDQSQ